MEHRELRVLGDWTFPLAALPHVANTWWRPTPRDGGAELEKDEVAELVYVEIFSPTTAGPVAEDLRTVIPVTDGVGRQDYCNLSGRYDALFCPPLVNAWANRIFSFGTPMSNNPLLNTTLKYKTDLTFHSFAGVNITTQYRIRAWGYVYKESELATAFGTMVFPAQIADRARNRALVLNKAPIPVSRATWLTLPGGKDQAPPKINPFIRYAYNRNATAGLQEEYALRYDAQLVTEAEENMYYDFDELDAILVEGLGVRAPVNLAFTYLNIGGNIHPKGRTVAAPGFPTEQFNNPLHFGWMSPFLPVGVATFRTIPRLDKPYLIWNEKGYVAIRDAGAVVGARATVVALTGIRIEIR